jgi:hypothetical protein
VLHEKSSVKARDVVSPACTVVLPEPSFAQNPKRTSAFESLLSHWTVIAELVLLCTSIVTPQPGLAPAGWAAVPTTPVASRAAPAKMAFFMSFSLGRRPGWTPATAGTLDRSR